MPDIARTIAELEANPDIRSVGKTWNTHRVRLPDGAEGDVVGDYYEGNADTGSVRKLIVAVPSRSEPERIDLPLFQTVRFLDLDRALPEK